ncbi:VacJ family lipoprotein [Marinobacter sp.]|uniref:MlaA family lipoprotein n=1 Tax=Marinobacter sp. TaxID=50741 RepID=UPI002B26FBCC|nr:VacJ family lipoprotein [Marinobacter sp.]
MTQTTTRYSIFAASMLVLFAIVGVAPAVAQIAQEPVGQPAAPVNQADPYENWNRSVFSFNETVDDWFLRPVAKTYRNVTPGVVDRGVTNFFNNLTEIRNFSNSLLQLKGESAVVAFGRFTFNTVFGLGGIFDVATAFDLPERPEDFGQTLGHWGMGSGPYLMLPFLGPSTPRHFTGLASDSLALPSAWDSVEEPETYYLRGLQIVDKRADFIPAEGLISGDRYTFVRNAFLQRREFLINDGKITSDPFANDDEDDLMLEDF